MNDILALAISTYGVDNQIDVAIEEMSELTKALVKLHRFERSGAGDPKEILSSIYEEMADVEIMLTQLEMIFECKTFVEDEKLAKVKRLKERLSNESI